MQVNQIPGIAIAVLVDGDVVYERAYGVANVELDVPVTEESVFELASLPSSSPRRLCCYWSRKGNSLLTTR